jgi:hypothetical protein
VALSQARALIYYPHLNFLRKQSVDACMPLRCPDIVSGDMPSK